MRCIIQRVREASVTIDGRIHAGIQDGLLIYAAFAPDDHEGLLDRMASKIVTLRVFDDSEGRMNRSLLDQGGSCLLVSQFTLYADCRKGQRPFYGGAATPQIAEPLFQKFHQALSRLCPTQSGIFSAAMAIQAVNVGPVTLILDSEMMNW